MGTRKKKDRRHRNKVARLVNSIHAKMATSEAFGRSEDAEGRVFLEHNGQKLFYKRSDWEAMNAWQRGERPVKEVNITYSDDAQACKGKRPPSYLPISRFNGQPYDPDMGDPADPAVQAAWASAREMMSNMAKRSDMQMGRIFLTGTSGREAMRQNGMDKLFYDSKAYGYMEIGKPSDAEALKFFYKQSEDAILGGKSLWGQEANKAEYPIPNGKGLLATLREHEEQMKAEREERKEEWRREYDRCLRDPIYFYRHYWRVTNDKPKDA